MSQTWMEDLESEDYESNDEADYEGVSSGEADYEEYGEADYEDYPEDARSDARRARQQRIMLERRRMRISLVGIVQGALASALFGSSLKT